MQLFFSTSHAHAYFMHTYLFFSFFVLSCDYVLFVFSLSLSRINCVWHPSANLLQIGTLFHSGSSSSFDHPPLHVRFCDEKAQQDFFENFSKCGVLWYYSTQCHSHSGMRISMWDTRELSHGDHMGVLLQYAWFWYFHTLFVTQIQGTRIVVTPKLISEVLIILRVSHPDYPTCPHLRTMSKDKLLSLFCETPFSWGECQNTLCLGFVKGPRFLNMEMTFVLHHLSHYNSITEPCAHFLLSLIEDLTIDLPSHFILSHRCL